MEILVINGSPKGKHSVTLQTVNYLQILHPEHHFEVLYAGQTIKALEKDFSPALAAIDAIGLFESGLDSLCDVTVAITAPEEDRILRLMARDHISEDYARSRIAAQHSNEWFSEKCSYTLENSGELDAFATKCLAFLHTIGIMKENS